MAAVTTLKASDYKTEVAAAFDRVAGTYDRLGVEFFGPMGRRLVERVAPAPGHRVLDVGCGSGACLFPAAARVGPAGRVVGIDIAAGMVETARAEAARRGVGNVEARVMDGERVDFPAASFDVVIGSYSLIFLPDVRSALRRYAQVLVPGGRIGFTSPQFRTGTFPFLPPVFTELIPNDLLRSLPEQWRPEALQRRFNSWLEGPADLRATMEAAGFVDVDVHDEAVPLVAATGEVWVDWSHTHGMRLMWDHLTADDAAALRARLIKALDEMRDGAGPLVIDTPVRFVTAQTPPVR
ncbi:Methyltransferase type 11 [Micromonospora aurantiaca ATCC 27029]|nr:Methyltransferase type 11 [Micromonospora aurantiaca ATCC 27029]